MFPVLRRAGLAMDCGALCTQLRQRSCLTTFSWDLQLRLWAGDNQHTLLLPIDIAAAKQHKTIMPVLLYCGVSIACAVCFDWLGVPGTRRTSLSMLYVG
jgi:hypothetical protein